MITAEETRIQSEAAFAQWGEQWKANAIENGKIHRDKGRSHKDIAGIGVGKQCVIAATGASLEAALPIIKEHREKFDLVAVDKTFLLLMDRGVKPDYVVIADANVGVSSSSSPVFKFTGQHDTTGITLVMNVNAAPTWSKEWKGPILFYVNKDNIETEKIYSQLSGCHDIIPAASNVGNTAVVFFALMAGYDQYLLTGYDFGWYPDGNYYAFTEDDKRYWMRHVYCVGIDGRLCYTSLNLNFSARWLTDFLTHQIPMVRLFNCSGHGILQGKQSDLEKQLVTFKSREPRKDELDRIINARVRTDTIPFEGPEKLLERLKPYKYIAGVKVDWLSSVPEQVKGLTAA